MQAGSTNTSASASITAVLSGRQMIPLAAALGGTARVG